jgi:hypothetical protein
MTSTVTYEGYIAQLTIDLDANVIHGEVINTRDVLTFSVRNLSEVRQALADTIEDYKEWCASLGQTVQKPLSGTMTLRMTPELHQAAANRAAMMKVSLNAWIVTTMECELGKRPAVLTAGEVDNRVAVGVKDEVVKILASRNIYGSDPEPPAWQKVMYGSSAVDETIQ